MKVSVDPVQCEANGVCVGIAPEVFDLDDDEVLQVRPGDLVGEEAERVAQAVQFCPRNALRVSD